MAGRALRFLDGRWVDTSRHWRTQKSFPFKNRQAVVFIMLLTTLASTFCTEMPPPESFRPSVHVCVRACVRVCERASVYVNVWVSVCIRVFACLCVCVCVCMCMCVYVSACVRA